MIHTDIDLLKEPVQTKVRLALDEMNRDEKLKSMGVASVRINESLRDLAVQMAYYSRGRMEPKDVQAMYRAAGLWAIGEAESKNMITWTLDSKHLRGEAADLVPIRAGQIWWGAPEAVWTRMGEIGEGHGLKWGGRWKTKDSPHFEV